MVIERKSIYVPLQIGEACLEFTSMLLIIVTRGAIIAKLHKTIEMNKKKELFQYEDFQR